MQSREWIWKDGDHTITVGLNSHGLCATVKTARDNQVVVSVADTAIDTRALNNLIWNLESFGGLTGQCEMAIRDAIRCGPGMASDAEIIARAINKVRRRG